MIKLLVCDDDVLFLKKILQNLDNVTKSFNRKYEIFSFQNSLDALSFLSKNDVHAVFLDIDMKEFSGFDLAKAISKKTSDIKIIFVSSYSNLVFDSFHYNPFWFLRKSDLSELSDILRRIDCIFTDNIIEVKYNNQILSMKASDIYYIESQRNYVILHYEQKELRIRATLKSLQVLLDPLYFLQPHASFLVNSRYIHWIDKKSNEIILLSGKTIPVSRRFKNSVIENFSKYLRKIERGVDIL